MCPLFTRYMYYYARPRMYNDMRTCVTYKYVLCHKTKQCCIIQYEEYWKLHTLLQVRMKQVCGHTPPGCTPAYNGSLLTTFHSQRACTMLYWSACIRTYWQATYVWHD